MFLQLKIFQNRLLYKIGVLKNIAIFKQKTALVFICAAFFMCGQGGIFTVFFKFNFFFG